MSTKVSVKNQNRVLNYLVRQGAIAGISGGLVFGVVMALIGMFPMVGMLIRQDNALIGLLVHLVISAVIGAGFGGIMYFLHDRKPGATIWMGGLYGVFWWILGGLILMPLLLGMPQMVLVVGQLQIASLVGHMLYGIITGMSMYILSKEEEKQWRTDFTNLLVHDLKSPLSVVTLSLNLVMSERLGGLEPNQRSLIQRAQRNVSEAFELISNLLDVERLEAKGFNLSLVPCDVAQLLCESVEAVSSLAEAKMINLSLTHHLMSSSLWMDTALIKRILQNLLSNAIKFTPEQGFIRIEAESTTTAVIVRIIDNGPGIPADFRKRIFDKFVQLKDAERRGTGLGLAFCKLAVEAHGGSIWVDGVPNGGSCFAFTLPVNVSKRNLF